MTVYIYVLHILQYAILLKLIQTTKLIIQVNQNLGCVNEIDRHTTEVTFMSVITFVASPDLLESQSIRVVSYPGTL